MRMRKRSKLCKMTIRTSLIWMVPLALAAASCESIPPGPPPKGPLVTVKTTNHPTPDQTTQPPTQTTTPANSNKNKNGDNGIDASDAVNAMVTSLATRCAPITTAAQPPRFVNRFVASSPMSNNLQMEVWRRLVRMGMVAPATNVDTPSPPSYELLGNITPLPFDGGSKKRYLWTLKAIDSKSGKVVWKEKIEFIALKK